MEKIKRFNFNETKSVEFINSVKELNMQFEKKNLRKRKAAIVTYGCQQNEADSEIFAGLCEKMGYEICDNSDIADLILVNTCAVREHAELKAISKSGLYKHTKAKNKDLIIGICGCMISQSHRAEHIKMHYPYINFTCATGQIYRLPELIYNALLGKRREFILNDEDENILCEGMTPLRSNNFSAWVSVMYGCNNFCSYCIVPYVRGRERSRKSADILAEIEDLVSRGYKDITLLGQNVNSYGKDIDENIDFADLLEKAANIKGDFCLRFMTSHPKDASKKLLDVIATNPKIAPHFHLPLQSGSDRILKLMNRNYTFESYYSLIEYLRSKNPNIALTSDMIVGFPGETEEDFLLTLEAVKKVRYDNVFSFIYSRRRGTPADKMTNQVPEEIKKQRYQRLVEVQTDIAYEINLRYENTVQRVLVEGVSKNDKNVLAGRTDTLKLVHFSGDESLIGKYVDVKIEKAQSFLLLGTLI